MRVVLFGNDAQLIAGSWDHHRHKGRLDTMLTMPAEGACCLCSFTNKKKRHCFTNVFRTHSTIPALVSILWPRLLAIMREHLLQEGKKDPFSSAKRASEALRQLQIVWQSGLKASVFKVEETLSNSGLYEFAQVTSKIRTKNDTKASCPLKKAV